MNDDASLDALNGLIKMSKNPECSGSTSAQHLEATETRMLFEGGATEWWAAAAELQALMPQCGGRTGDAVNRGWFPVAPPWAAEATGPSSRRRSRAQTRPGPAAGKHWL